MRKFILTNFQDYEAIAFKCVYKALIVECIRRSIHGKELEDEKDCKYYFDGHYWMQDSIENWQRRFPYLSPATIKRYFKELCDKGYVVRQQANSVGGRLPTFYRINPEVDLFLKIQKAKDHFVNEAQSSERATAMAQDDPTRGSERATASLITNISLINQTNISPENPCLVVEGVIGQTAALFGEFPSALFFNGTQQAIFPLKNGQTLLENYRENFPNNEFAPKVKSPTPKESKTTVWESTDEFAQIFENLNKLQASKRQFHREKYRSWLKELMEHQATSIDKLAVLADEWQKYHNSSGGKKPTKISISFGNWVKNHFAWGKDQQHGNTGRVFQKERMGEQGYQPFDNDLLARINAVPT